MSLVSGATGGLGKAIATALAREGGTVVVLGRSEARAEDAIRDIQAVVPNAALEPLASDLSSQASIRSAVDEFHSRHQKLNVLVNAAGVFRKERQVTPDGLEVTFATNVMGYFLLTNLLVDSLKQGASEDDLWTSRVVNIASKYSGGPSVTKIDFDDLQTTKRKYSYMRATPPTMLGRVLLTQEFAERLRGSNVVVNAVHPGLVKNTGLLQDVGGPFRWLTNTLGKPAEEAADTPVWLATSPDTAAVTGKLWAKRKELPTPGMGSDPASRKRLWEECTRLAKIL
ncbi:SDR family NAD(P)-dependent oxidoreductase [Paenarthrobacter nitroguajacolicus]|uniref:SDR family NAD(P)-dependent oxidoreductase n=1 Tax=Paenarthrobacter nitroguajacolicus TaxID=211146 RepID=UPI002863FBFE|nr:SDR family NAD(P)-dependent oxidoreductase [Paenarthrobacter nitroguajacolicus]MDR6637407.1 NAD(P)-dependent dehydrogenase (short-subunit alcohol dehydrogenase family) [Paenarthrobacter nitroguajacolicus]